MVVVACFEGMFVEELAAAEDGAGLGDEAADLPLLQPSSRSRTLRRPSSSNQTEYENSLKPSFIINHFGK